MSNVTARKLKCDLEIGAKYGRLTITADNKDSPRTYVCRCSCGEAKTVSAYALLRPGNTVSCGCYQRVAAKRAINRYHAARRSQKEQAQ